MEIILRPDVAENEIGDLEEEYRAKARRENLQCARKWFWIQVFRTLIISIKEDGLGRILLGKATQWYGRLAQGLPTFPYADRLRYSWIILITVFLVVGLSMLYMINLTKLKEPLAQRQDVPYQLGTEELPKLNANSKRIPTYETNLPPRSTPSQLLPTQTYRPIPPKIGDQSLSKSKIAVEPSDLSLDSPELSLSHNYVATAYSLRGRGTSGLGIGKGTIAADPRLLPYGTRVRLDAGSYSGEYVVTDSSSAAKGNKIDVWVPTFDEACNFGRRSVKLTVLSYGKKTKS